MSVKEVPANFAPPSSDLFLITRTSTCDWTVRPHQHAFSVSVIRVDERSVDCPSRVPFNFGETSWWYGEGTNHRVEDGHIKRDMGYDNCWAIKISSIDELMIFIEQNGQCIVSIDREGYQCIEIYDTYRE